MSCSSNRNRLVGSCSSTFVSTTNSLGVSVVRGFLPPMRGLDSTTASRVAGVGRASGLSGPRATGASCSRSGRAGSLRTGINSVAGLVGALGSGISGAKGPSGGETVSGNRLHAGQDFFDMVRNFHSAPLATQHSAAVDDEGAAFDAAHLLAVHVL